MLVIYFDQPLHKPSLYDPDPTITFNFGPNGNNLQYDPFMQVLQRTI